MKHIIAIMPIIKGVNFDDLSECSESNSDILEHNLEDDEETLDALEEKVARVKRRLIKTQFKIMKKKSIRGKVS